MISVNGRNEGGGESVLSQKQYDTGRLGMNLCPNLFLKIETGGDRYDASRKLNPKRSDPLLRRQLTHFV